MQFLRVSSKSSPSSVAGAIAGMIKDGMPVEVQSVGAGAVNQAVKAIAIARGFLAPIGIEIVCCPAFADVSIGGEVRTAIRFSVEPRYLRGGMRYEDDEKNAPCADVSGYATSSLSDTVTIGASADFLGSSHEIYHDFLMEPFDSELQEEYLYEQQERPRTDRK